MSDVEIAAAPGVAGLAPLTDGGLSASLSEVLGVAPAVAAVESLAAAGHPKAALLVDGPRRRAALRRYRVVKRAFDLVVGSVALLVALPVILVASALVVLDSPGSPFYRQRRVGVGGREFWCWKIRTMYDRCDDEIHRQHLRRLIKNGATDIAERLPADPRITRIGQWLRMISIDELPQLWNVVNGTMSLVGPRPPIPYEVACYQQWHLRRLEVPGGLTGLWQVTQRGQVTFDEMCRLDIEYIERRSIWQDLRILARTPAAVFSRRGAG